MINLKRLCVTLSEKVREGELFWYDAAPRSYSSGLLLSGINFALCGLNPLNDIDNRWLTLPELTAMGLCVDENAMMQPLLVWTETHSLSLYSLPAFNAWQLNPPTEVDRAVSISIQFAQVVDLSSDPQPHFVLLYGAIKNLGVSGSMPVNKALYLAALSRLHQIHNSIYGGADDALIRVAADLTVCKILHSMNIKPPRDRFDHTIRIINQLPLKKAPYALQLALLQTFARADWCASELLNRP